MSFGVPVVSTDMTTPTFTGMHTVAVPVTDQERTQALFERFGLQIGLDTELQPGFRWIEMALADSPTSLALVQTGPELPAGIDTGIRLTTTDARVLLTPASSSLASTRASSWTGRPPRSCSHSPTTTGTASTLRRCDGRASRWSRGPGPRRAADRTATTGSTTRRAARWFGSFAHHSHGDELNGVWAGQTGVVVASRPVRRIV